MPQTDIYLCKTDVLEVGRMLFEIDAKIIPDVEYATPEPLTISTTKDLSQLLDGLACHCSLRFHQNGNGVQSNYDP